MFYEEIRIKQDLSYISFGSLRILNNSKKHLWEHFLVVTRVQCSLKLLEHSTEYSIPRGAICQNTSLHTLK